MAKHRTATMTPDQIATPATRRFGPHLLGRRYVPDSRDWRMERLLELDARFTAAETVQQLADDPAFDVFSVPFLWRFVQQLRRRPPAPPPPPPPPPPPGLPWDITDAALDQGQSPHCVGGTMCEFGNSTPVVDRYVNADLHRLYYACKVKDGEPGLENGTSIRSGLEVLKDWGRIAGYAFAQSLSEVDFWLTTKGPVPVGTDWYDGMFWPDSDGLIHPAGHLAGGHAWLILSQESRAGRACYKMLTPWGPSWGQNGHAWIAKTDFNSLLMAQGDAGLALELPLKAA